MYRACYYMSRADDLKVKYCMRHRATREEAWGDLDRAVGRQGYTGGHIEEHIDPFGWIIDTGD